MLTSTEVETGYRERTIEFGAGSELKKQRQEHNRVARSPAVRRELLEKRVELTKRARALESDKEWHKKLAAAEAAIVAAKKEFDLANEPFKRLELAKAAVHNTVCAFSGVESAQKTALLALQREAERAEDFVWSDVVGELTIAHDEAMRSRSGPHIERARQTLKAALKTAAELPYRFTGTWAKWDGILTSLKRLASTRGSDFENTPKWDEDDVFDEDKVG